MSARDEQLENALEPIRVTVGGTIICLRAEQQSKVCASIDCKREVIVICEREEQPQKTPLPIVFIHCGVKIVLMFLQEEKA
jgi:hypothetical protein